MPPEVLIVGAGPTGLMLALQLVRRGIRLRIVDRNAGPSRESRAVVVHARTLEYFQQMGVGDEAVREGRSITRMRLLQRGRTRAEIPIGRLGMGLTRYPFVLALGQDQTEALLIAKLAEHGVRVERSTEVASIEDLGATLRVTLKHGTAADELLEVPWLCGCDGASSVVRHSMALPFEGGTYEHRFYLADCHVAGPVDEDGVTVAIESHRLVAFFAMAGDRRFRVLGRLPPDLATNDQLSFEQMAALSREASRLPITLSAPRWTSVYRLHHRCASRLRGGREERTMILGDAAHVHSPVGGQGMNTGLQDATNLAWKLAMVIRGGATNGLLASFESERLPVARRLLRTTDRIFTFATHDSVVVRALRSILLSTVAPRLFRFSAFRRAAFRVLSQTGIGYADDPLAALARSGGALTTPLAPGVRLPFDECAGGDGHARDLGDLCRAPWFTAIAVGAFEGDTGNNASVAIAGVARTLQRFPSLAPFVALRTITAIAANRAALEALGATPPTSPRLVIVRPDLHLFGCWPLDRATDAFATLDSALRESAR